MLILGIYDDIYDADFKLKFLLQIIVANLNRSRVYNINFYGFFGIYEVPRLLAQATTIFVFLVVVNSINFIDGIDGLAITESIKIILLIEYFSHQNTPLYKLVFNNPLTIPLIILTKKRKFLGDSGSLLLGH